MKKTIPLETGDAIRQIEGDWDGNITLSGFTATCNGLLAAFKQPPHSKKKIGRTTAEIAVFNDLYYGLDRNLCVIECHLGAGYDGVVREVAEAGIMAGLRFMALRTRLDWPHRSNTLREDYGLRDFLRSEHALKLESSAKLSKVAVVDRAIKKWSAVHPQRQLPITRSTLLSHYSEIILQNPSMMLQSVSKKTGKK